MSDLNNDKSSQRAACELSFRIGRQASAMALSVISPCQFKEEIVLAVAESYQQMMLENLAMQKEIEELREALKIAYMDMTGKRNIDGDEFAVMQQLLESAK